MLSLLLLALAAAPAQPSPVLATLTRSMCFGTCPAYTVTVHADGTVDWQGRDYVEVEGEKPGIARLTPKELHALIAAFEAARYLDLKERQPTHMATDHPSIETSFHHGGRARSIHDYLGSDAWPSELRELEKKFDDIVGTQRWIGSGPSRARRH